jgi:hypothetical protein
MPSWCAGLRVPSPPAVNVWIRKAPKARTPEDGARDPGVSYSSVTLRTPPWCARPRVCACGIVLARLAYLRLRRLHMGRWSGSESTRRLRARSPGFQSVGPDRVYVPPTRARGRTWFHLIHRVAEHRSASPASTTDASHP